MKPIESIAALQARVDPVKFLRLLEAIAKRTESGRSESISLTECKTWGFEAEEAVPYLLLMVETGIVKQRLQVYDDEDDVFEDFRGQVDLNTTDPNRLKLWFRPAVSAEVFATFFCDPSGGPGGDKVYEAAKEGPDSNFLPHVMQHFENCTIIGDMCMTKTDNSKNVTTGNVTGSVVGNDISNSGVGASDAAPLKPVTADKAPGKGLLALLALGIISLFGFAIASMMGASINNSAASLIKLATAGFVSPYLGTMVGTAAFSMKSDNKHVPTSVKATGVAAVFLSVLVVLHYLNIPCPAQ